MVEPIPAENVRVLSIRTIDGDLRAERNRLLAEMERNAKLQIVVSVVSVVMAVFSTIAAVLIYLGRHG